MFKKVIQKDLMIETIKLAWPAVLEAFFVAIAGMIDTVMVSSLGPYAVAATGLTIQPKFISLAFFFAINIAVSALVARRNGEGDKKSANEVFVTACVISFIICFILSFISYWQADQIVHWCGSNTDTHETAMIYFKVIQVGMFFNVLQMIINAAQRGAGNTRIAMTTNIVSSLVNIFFNYLLINGHFGFPKWGVFGAALATVLGTIIASFLSLRSIMKNECFISLPFIIHHKIKASKDVLKKIFDLGSTLLLENVAMRIGFLATSVLAARLGTDAFAAHQVGMNLLGIGFSFADGMQVAAVALIGRSLGEKKTELAKTYGHLCQYIGLFISIILAIILIFFGKAIFGAFFQKESILEMGKLLCAYISLIILLQISEVIYGGCLRGAGDIRFTLIAFLISTTFIRTVVTIFLTLIFNFGLSGIWLGIMSDQLSRLILFGGRFHQGKWVNIKI